MSRPSAIDIATLIAFLRSPPCAQLDKLILRGYRIVSPMTEDDDGSGLPPVTRLWVSSSICVCNLANLFALTLRYVAEVGQEQDAWSNFCRFWSGQGWTSLTSICIAGWFFPTWHMLDLTRFSNLRQLEMLVRSHEHNTLHAILLPPHLESLVILVGLEPAFELMASIGTWLRDSAPAYALRSVCLRIDCVRDWRQSTSGRFSSRLSRCENSQWPSAAIFSSVCPFVCAAHCRSLVLSRFVAVPADTPPSQTSNGVRASRLQRLWSGFRAARRRRRTQMDLEDTHV